MLALAMLDGWGEEWQQGVAMQWNIGTHGQHWKTPHDFRRRFPWLDEPATQPEQTHDWSQVTAQLAAMCGVQPNG